MVQTRASVTRKRRRHKTKTRFGAIIVCTLSSAFQSANFHSIQTLQSNVTDNILHLYIFNRERERGREGERERGRLTRRADNRGSTMA